MKKIIAISIILTLIIALASNPLFAENKKEKTVVFMVNMDCHGCKVKIEDNIPYEKGIKDLKVNLDEKIVTITYRIDKTNDIEIIKAFAKIGYEAKISGQAETDKRDGNSNQN